MKRAARRIINRTHRNKWLLGAVAGLMGSAPTLVGLIDWHGSPLVLMTLTAAAFVVAGVSHFVEPDGE